MLTTKSSLVSEVLAAVVLLTSDHTSRYVSEIICRIQFT
jgi:hypothetical protein